MTCARLISFHSFFFFVKFLRVSIFVVVVFGTSNDLMQKCAVIVINTREEFHLFDLRFVTRELDTHFTHFPFEVFTRWLCIKHLFFIFFWPNLMRLTHFYSRLTGAEKTDDWRATFREESPSHKLHWRNCNKMLKFRTK